MSDLVIELKKPYVFEGAEFNTIDLTAVEDLSGLDLINAKKTYAQRGGFSTVLSTDPEYCAIVAAKATKQPIEFFEQMPAQLYNKVTMRVMGFLNADTDE